MRQAIKEEPAGGSRAKVLRFVVRGAARFSSRSSSRVSRSHPMGRGEEMDYYTRRFNELKRIYESGERNGTQDGTDEMN